MLICLKWLYTVTHCEQSFFTLYCTSCDNDHNYVYCECMESSWMDVSQHDRRTQVNKSQQGGGTWRNSKWSSVTVSCFLTFTVFQIHTLYLNFWKSFMHLAVGGVLLYYLPHTEDMHVVPEEEGLLWFRHLCRRMSQTTQGPWFYQNTYFDLLMNHCSYMKETDTHTLLLPTAMCMPCTAAPQ